MSISVQLDNYEGQYYPGNTIVGRVICTLSSTKNIRGVKLKLRGKEHNEWTERETYYDHHHHGLHHDLDHDRHDRLSSRRKTRFVHYSGDNSFLQVEHTLKGEGDLGPGRFEYPFSFQLPNNIPCTYHGKYGGVTFTLDAKVDRPLKIDYTDSREIKVVSPINLNDIMGQLQLQPVSYSDDTYLCCWCCTSGAITMEVYLEKEAFVPGEVAKVKVDVTNMSNTNVNSINVKLIMEINARVTIPNQRGKSDTELLAICTDTGVGAHGQNTYNFDLEIPQSAVVPNFNLCTLFSQNTKLKVTAVLPTCHSNLEVETGVTMGNIGISDPSQKTQAAPYPPPSYPSEKSPYPDAQGPVLYPPFPTPGFPSPNPIGFTSSNFAPPSNSAPYPSAGPSAPPSEGRPSAPSKQEVAEGEFVMVGETDNPAGPDNPNVNQLPPPSYNDAVSYPPK